MIILAALLALVSGVAAWRKPAWGAWVVLAALPTYQLRFTFFSFPTTVLEWVLLASVLGACIHWAQHPGTFPQLQRRTYFFALLWLVVGGVGVAVAQDTVAALGLYRAYIVEPLLTLPLWFVAWQYGVYRRGLLVVASVQLMLAAAVSGLQILHIVPSPEPWVSESPARVVGYFAYPNAMALYVAPLTALLAACALVLRTAKRWERTLWIIGALGGLLASAFAVSRGAIVALGVAAIILGAWSRKKWLWWAVCTALLACVIVIPSTREKIVDVVTLRDTSTDVRTVLWRGTWRLIADRPFTGAGLGAFPQTYKLYKDDQHVELLQYPHNILLNTWVEFGIAGIFVLLGVLFWLSSALIRRLHNHDPWAVGVLMAWIVLVIHGLVDVPYFKNDLAVLTLFLLAIAAPLRATESNNPPV